MKLIEKLKIKIAIARLNWTKRKVLERTQHYGLASLGLLLQGLVRLLYGKDGWKGFGFDSTSTIRWTVPSFKYFISLDKIAGVDAALKENLTPGEAVDKLAREVGISEDVIRAASHQNKKQPLRIWVNKNYE